MLQFHVLIADVVDSGYNLRQGHHVESALPQVDADENEEGDEKERGQRHQNKPHHARGGLAQALGRRIEPGHSHHTMVGVGDVVAMEHETSPQIARQKPHHWVV